MADGSVITCPECEKKFKRKPEWAGKKKIRCPFCEESVRLPSDDAPQTKASAAPVEPAPAPVPVDDPDTIDPYGVKEQSLWPRCPNCANEMETKDAIICLFCGYNTLTRIWGKTTKTTQITTKQHLKWLAPGIAVFTIMVLTVVLLLYYCLVVPYQVGNSWLSFIDHESLRMWATLLLLGQIWGMGMYCFKRFILEPKPPDEPM